MNSLARFIWISLPIVLLLSTAIFVPVKLYDDSGYKRVQRISAELEALKDQNRRIRRENAAVVKKIRAIQSDPDYIENIARNEMGMIARDEVVYQF